MRVLIMLTIFRISSEYTSFIEDGDYSFIAIVASYQDADREFRNMFQVYKSNMDKPFDEYEATTIIERYCNSKEDAIKYFNEWCEKQGE